MKTIIFAVAFFTTYVLANRMCMPPQVNVLPRSGCAGYVECENTLCSCTTGTYSPTALSCAWGQPSCQTLNTCLSEFAVCLETLINVAAVEGEANACMTWATPAHGDLIAVAAGTTSANETALLPSCEYALCSAANATGLSQCTVETRPMCQISLATPAPSPDTATTSSAPTSVPLELNGASSVTALVAVIVALCTTALTLF